MLTCEEEKYQLKAMSTEINNIKEDISELKIDKKDNQKLFNETITSMEKNIQHLTTLTEEIVKYSAKQDKRLDKQDARLDKQDDKLDNIDHIVTRLNTKIDTGNEDTTKWLQGFIDKYFGITMKTLLIIILVLLGVKLTELDISTFLK